MHASDHQMCNIYLIIIKFCCNFIRHNNPVCLMCGQSLANIEVMSLLIVIGRYKSRTISLSRIGPDRIGPDLLGSPVRVGSTRTIYRLKMKTIYSDWTNEIRNMLDIEQRYLSSFKGVSHLKVHCQIAVRSPSAAIKPPFCFFSNASYMHVVLLDR